MESRVPKTQLKVVRYPYESWYEQGEVYYYVNNDWILMEDIGKWEEIYDTNGENMGKVRGDRFVDYREERKRREAWERSE